MPPPRSCLPASGGGTRRLTHRSGWVLVSTAHTAGSSGGYPDESHRAGTIRMLVIVWLRPAHWTGNPWDRHGRRTEGCPGTRLSRRLTEGQFIILSSSKRVCSIILPLRCPSVSFFCDLVALCTFCTLCNWQEPASSLRCQWRLERDTKNSAPSLPQGPKQAFKLCLT